MPRFMDFHEDLKLPQEAIDQIAQGTREGAADEFGVRQLELYHNADGQGLSRGEAVSFAIACLPCLGAL